MVSIIIPTYNRYEWLMSAIASVKAQTFKQYEMLIIDDCSTDSRYSETDWDAMGVRYFRTDKNYRNPFTARNIGMENAENQLVAFLDDDDSWMPDKLEKQVPVMNDECLFSATEAYYSNTDRIYNPNKKYEKYLSEHFWKFISDKFGFDEMPKIITKEMIDRWNILITSSVMINKKLIEKSGVFVKDTTRPKWEDWVYWEKCLDYTDCFFIKEPLVFYNDAPRKKYISRT